MSARDLALASVPSRALRPQATTAPPTLRIVLMLVGMVALPLSSYWTGATVGSFRMFSDPHHYALALHTFAAGRSNQVPPALLAPHLGLDARRWILPAMRMRPVYGETAASLLAGGLADLAALSCKLTPDATRARAQLTRSDLDGRQAILQTEIECADTRAR